MKEIFVIKRMQAKYLDAAIVDYYGGAGSFTKDIFGAAHLLEHSHAVDYIRDMLPREAVSGCFVQIEKIFVP